MRVEPARKHRLAAPRDPPRHRDRLPAGGRAVVHRGVGDVAAVEPRDLGLELEQALERALGDFGLIGRVAGQELAALDQVIDAGRDMVAIGAAADEEGRIAGGDIGRRASAPSWRSTLKFGGMVGQALDRAGEPRRLGHVDEQIVDRGGADRAQASRAGRRRTKADNAFLAPTLNPPLLLQGRGTMRSMVEGLLQARQEAPPPPCGWSPSPGNAGGGLIQPGFRIEKRSRT